jgi:hypothetical protein
MRRKTIIAEAQRLIEQSGANASDNVRELEREAKRRRNLRLAAFYGELARQIEKEIGSPEQLSSRAASRPAGGHQSHPRSTRRDRDYPDKRDDKPSGCALARIESASAG